MTQTKTHRPKIKRLWLRIPLMVMAVGTLLAGLWAGLLRIGWRIPPLSSQLATEHGPLMVAGFLGTLISLERAVALSQLQQGRRVYYLVPLLAGIGTIALFLPIPAFIPRLLITLAGVGFAIIFIVIYRIQPATHNAIMSLGVWLWLLGSGLWLSGLPLYRVVPWWAGFLVLTIAGERLELARMLILTKKVRTMFFVVVGIVIAGLLLSLAYFDIGMRMMGIGWAALGVWLLRFDIARRTIRQKGLTRFIAACLLLGYIWLTLGGVLWIAYGGSAPAGPFYDAMLHTVFVGFVFSMIFGHAPVIIPAVMGVPIKYLPAFYVHLGILHLSLALRVVGDLLLLPAPRRWGGLLNEVAITLFILITILAARLARQNRQI